VLHGYAVLRPPPSNHGSDVSCQQLLSLYDQICSAVTKLSVGGKFLCGGTGWSRVTSDDLEWPF